ncbi:hypothetical protein [Sphingobium abikonense]|uniref:hypothetical protein n=1 Tax=Sphingobium abikonense TaxID=86193 RepID=UPI003512294A
MLELKIKAGRRNIPIFDLPAALGRREAYREIGDQIDALIAFMDRLEGDADLEDATDLEDDFAISGAALAEIAGVPGCAISDADATTYIEWHTRGSHKLAHGGEMLTRNVYGEIGHEDDEDCDPAEDDDISEDDDPAEHDDFSERSEQPVHTGWWGLHAVNDA